MSLDWLSNAQKKDSTELFLLSANATFLLNEGSKKKKSEEMKLYPLQKQAALWIYPHPVWPLPVWLGGHYANIVKPGYPPQCPTKAQFWIISHLHLAICTTKYLYTPYVTHNKPRISVCLANGQFSSFKNEHFFEQTALRNLKNSILSYFEIVWLSHMYKGMKIKKKPETKMLLPNHHFLFSRKQIQNQTMTTMLHLELPHNYHFLHHIYLLFH